MFGPTCELLKLGVSKLLASRRPSPTVLLTAFNHKEVRRTENTKNLCISVRASQGRYRPSPVSSVSSSAGCIVERWQIRVVLIARCGAVDSTECDVLSFAWWSLAVLLLPLRVLFN